LTLAEEYKRHPEMLYSVSGFVLGKDEEKKLSKGDLEKINCLSQKGILGEIDNLVEIAENEAHFVIITSSLEKDKLKQFIEELSAKDIVVRVVPSIFELAPRNMEFDEIGNVPVIGFRDIPMQGWEAVAKRLFDIIGSCLGLILLLPLFIIVAILIKRESPGPVFFSQERIGQNGRPFRMYKFRSMKLEAANAPPVKVTGDFDPRVTKIGRFIRKTSIDELPQLFNVLKGDMSLVGPRPETYLYVNQYTDWNKRRLYLRPGLTGLAQALGVRGDTSIDEKTKYDLEYMRNQSFWLDIKILFLTMVNLFRHKEAY
jgi:exopolysaccharide biosynthesis polyprenyl glycosylphosphotransferase